MARMSSRILITTFFVLSGAFAGCGSDGEDNDGTSGSSGANTSGGPFSSGSGTGTGTSGGAGSVGNVDPTAACASAHDGAVLPPISLVFMIDRSTSMRRDGFGDNQTSTLELRWNPVKDGLLAFLGDSASANVSASLSFFPINVGTGDPPSPDCDASHYADQIVPMTQLPNAGAFTTAFNTGPDGYTPTTAALTGAITTARTVKAEGKNVAVVLATDGQPLGCTSNGNTNTVASVNAAAAAGMKDGIKTYVIGVGPSTGNLNSFAENGGTGTAIMIPTDNPAQVSADLIKAIGQIKSSLLGCNYGLPTPPQGQTLNVNAVNVNYTPPVGAASTLPYSFDCANANGWHYDDTSSPREIILCDGMCNTAKAATGAKLDIIFGCETAVPTGGQDPNGNIR